MLLALSRGAQKIHVLGDSKLVINWMNLKRPPKNVFLNPLYEEFARVASLFQIISFQNIFRERNDATNILFKQGLHVGDGLWHQWEMINDTITKHDLRPHQSWYCLDSL